jgi:hypothetical protein
LAELARLGARSLPVVSRGDKFIIAQSLNTLADFVGLKEQMAAALSPTELAAKVDLILEGAQRFVRQIPDDKFELKLKNRDRSYRVLCHHLFRIPEAFVEAQTTGSELVHASLVAPPVDALQTPGQVADYGGEVRRRFAEWWQKLPDKSGTQAMRVYWGQHTLHEVLERTTWHSGQHVRQVMMLLEGLAITPDRPLGPADFAGLPMPQSVWDD